MRPVIFLFISVFAMAILLYFVKADQKRRAALAVWASKRDWTYAAQDDSMLRRLDEAPFLIDTSRKASNVMSGSLGNHQATVFDYQYKVKRSGSQNSSTSVFRVFVLSMPCAVGGFWLKPEGFVENFVDKFGSSDVQLESEAFNRAYRLTASSQKLAYNLVPATTIDLLLTHPHTNLHTDRDLLVSVERGKLDVTELDAKLAVLGQFLDNVPDFVWDDHGA